jgi:hypothetical protein
MPFPYFLICAAIFCYSPAEYLFLTALNGFLTTVLYLGMAISCLFMTRSLVTNNGKIYRIMEIEDKHKLMIRDHVRKGEVVVDFIHQV